jgi:hypothetical protein
MKPITFVGAGWLAAVEANTATIATPIRNLIALRMSLTSPSCCHGIAAEAAENAIFVSSPLS